MNFAFLEGGVGWAANLYSDIIGHWEKRNLKALRANLDPALVDRELLAALIAKHGPETQPVSGGLTDRPAEPADMLDEWAACGIEQAEDIKTRFVDRFYFGCEADDPINAWATHTELNPLGSKLKTLFSSDIGHWDVPDFTGVLPEAWELVEDDLVDREQFRDFVFGNVVRLFGGTNAEFFAGTVVADQVASVLDPIA